jgi:hypothetical protein
MRVMFVGVVPLTLSAAGAVLLALGVPEGSVVVVTLFAVGPLAAILIPAVIIYGIWIAATLRSRGAHGGWCRRHRARNASRYLPLSSWAGFRSSFLRPPARA